MPEGYFLPTGWICDQCGSCPVCGGSLENEPKKRGTNAKPCKYCEIEIVIDEEIHFIQASEHLMCWTKGEWIEDPSVVYSIANAIKLAYTDPNKLREIGNHS
jgi:hypothetical protein